MAHLQRTLSAAGLRKHFPSRRGSRSWTGTPAGHRDFTRRSTDHNKKEAEHVPIPNCIRFDAGACCRRSTGELCDFVKEISAVSPEAIKSEVLEDNVTIANFTIYATDLRAPLDGFQTCVLEQRTKSSGDLSRLLVCHHGAGEERRPLSEERFKTIGGQLDECVGRDGLGTSSRLMWMPAPSV